MLVSCLAIQRPRRPHTCDACGERISGPHLRLYGRAEKPDPLYVIRLHATCTTWDNPKILAAKAKLSAAPPEEKTE